MANEPFNNLSKPFNLCVFCWYARMRDDICGIYCVGSAMKNKDGTCDKFKEYKSEGDCDRADGK